VLISSEQPLGAEFAPYLYRGNPAALHDVLAHCRLCLGESATLASEASVLGVPSIYAAHTGRGYTDEQEEKYGLVTNLQQLDAEAIIAAASAILEQPRGHWQLQRQRLLDDCVDVTGLIVQLAKEFGKG
jgi:predicted glycosyltransferase